MSLRAEWAPWARAILRFGDGELVVDLSEPVPAPARAAFRRLGLDRPFAVITPCNPSGRVLAAGANAARLEAARAELAARRLIAVSVTGSAPAGDHHEPGWALGITQEAALALAERWEQLGLYWWDGVAFSIVPVEHSSRPIRLPLP